MDGRTRGRGGGGGGGEEQMSKMSNEAESPTRLKQQMAAVYVAFSDFTPRHDGKARFFSVQSISPLSVTLVHVQIFFCPHPFIYTRLSSALKDNFSQLE